MDAHRFLDILESLGDGFYAGVPDSLLSPFIDAVVEKYGVSDKHIVAANEGAAVGLAAGHYLATSRSAIVYMQNSGIGNAVNPICSLLHSKVYSIPVIFVIGWRGEPGTKDEPQHVFQGEITLPLLDCLEIPYQVVEKDLIIDTDKFQRHLENGRSVAFVIRKGAISNSKKMTYSSEYQLSRERALEILLSYNRSKEDIFVCTTGKLSREVFEIRERANAGHGRDFLTVGSMGHSLMIALGIAIAKPEKRIWCLDGDGSVLMHMGSLAVVGVHHPKNLVHAVINNGAHETVGGLPTVCKDLRLGEAARAAGYSQVYHAATQEELTHVLNRIEDGLVFIEIMCNLDSRADLGRPTTTPVENKNALMALLKGEAI
jgi:phosphonopyruvate decarboxylase